MSSLKEGLVVLVELGLVEQRYQAVLEVLSGATVSDVARRYGVVRQTVHVWLRRYADSGLAGLADRSSRTSSSYRPNGLTVSRSAKRRSPRPPSGAPTRSYESGGG